MSSSGEAADGFVSELGELLREFYWRELLGLKENGEPRSGGFTGLLGIVDEVAQFGDISQWSSFTPSYTPKEFNRIWGSFSHEAKVQYVKNLILRG